MWNITISKLFQPSSPSVWNNFAPKLFQNYFRDLLQLMNVFQHVQCRWKSNFIIPQNCPVGLLRSFYYKHSSRDDEIFCFVCATNGRRITIFYLQLRFWSYCRHWQLIDFTSVYQTSWPPLLFWVMKSYEFSRWRSLISCNLTRSKSIFRPNFDEMFQSTADNYIMSSDQKTKVRAILAFYCRFRFWFFSLLSNWIWVGPLSAEY